MPGPTAGSTGPAGGRRRDVRGGGHAGRCAPQLARHRQFWEYAVRLAEGRERSDLEWLVEFDTLIRQRPADRCKRLTAGERERLVHILNTVERLPRGGRTPAAARRSHCSSCRGSAPACRPASSRPTACPWSPIRPTWAGFSAGADDQTPPVTDSTASGIMHVRVPEFGRLPPTPHGG